MRWRFLDRIDYFAAWSELHGRKAVSFEEYSLLKPFGRKGAFPESLVLESCVAAVRWLVLRSSDFGTVPLLNGVDRFTFNHEVRAGDVLELEINLLEIESACVVAACSVRAGDRAMASGQLTFQSVEAARLWDPEKTRILWERLYAAA